MPEQLFLSEYISEKKNRTAWVVLERSTGQYMTICHEHNQQVSTHRFNTEQLAEDYAEDWCLP